MTTSMQPDSKTLRVNDLALHYLEWGEAGAPDIVCVHGYTGSADAFNALARRLQDRFHILAPDVRGHGESAWSPAGAYGYADQAGDLAAFVDRLGLDRFVLIGTSMGGIIAMAYAVAHPQRLRGLVINDIGPRPRRAPSASPRWSAADRRSLRRWTTPWRTAARCRRSWPGGAPRTSANWRSGVLRQRPDGRWGWKMDPAYIRQRVEHGPPRRPELWTGLPALACPTLVVWGTESDVLSEAQARRMVGALPHGELVKVSGVGHAPTLVEPQSLDALERLLAAL